MAGLGHWYIEIEKQSYWRGSQHTWVNRYVMSGSDPTAGDAASVIGILKGIEDKIHATVASGAGVGFVQGRAYRSTGGAPFAVVPYNASLAPATATGFTGPTTSATHMTIAPTLEVCMGIHTKLNGLSSSGKPLYMRKFIRGVAFSTESADNSTPIPGTDITGIQALVLPWQTGMGTNNWVVISPKGTQAAAAPIVIPYLINHQVPRGRKRKTSSSKSGGVIGELSSALGALGGAAQIGETAGALI